MYTHDRAYAWGSMGHAHNVIKQRLVCSRSNTRLLLLGQCHTVREARGLVRKSKECGRMVSKPILGEEQLPYLASSGMKHT